MLTRRRFGGVATATGLIGAAVPLRFGRAQSRPVLTIAVDNLWANMAPINGLSTTSNRIFPNFYESLVLRDFLADPEGLTLVPQLATGWERNGNVWSFAIRQGVMFHDGTEMTAEDVAFTLGADRLWGPKPFEPRGRSFTGGFKRVEATGRYTVEIETERPDANIPGKLTNNIGFVVPKAYYLDGGVERFGQAPVGTGPYRVTTFRSGEVMELEAFEGYWGAQPPASKLVFKIIPEFAARLAGVVSGEFDFIVNIPTDQEPVLERYDNVTLVRRQAQNYPAFAFNTLPDPPDNPLVDPRLRYAMVQGVDMHTIVGALFGEATYHPAVPFNFVEYGPFYDPDAKPKLPYDPAAARALVRQTAYKGQPLEWHITRQFYPNYEAAAEIMVEQWREIGVNVVAEVLDNFQLVYQRPFHLMNMSMSSDFIPGDPYQPLWLDWGPTATRSTASWKTWTPTEEFVRLGRIFEATVELEERKAAFLALKAEWERVTPGMYLWKSVYNWAHRKDIAWTPVADSDMRLWAPYLTAV